jgi:hypothetical protein
MNELFEEIDGCGAELSYDEIYRYTLTRQWDDGKCVAWICFNPSTATATEDDPSVRRMVGFSRMWGYGRMVLLNLYAVRSTDPKEVKRLGDNAIGPMNDYWILEAVKESREIVCAWGCSQHAPNILKRVQSVLGRITNEYPEFPINCLGYRKDGHPRHPLMLSYETPREMFTWGNLVK